MNIVYLITRANQGGAQLNVLSLARETASRGHTVRVVTGENGWLTENAAAVGIKTVVLRGLRRSWNPLLLPLFALGLRQELRRNPVHVLHLHSSNSLFGIFATYGLGRSRPKIVATVHGLSVLSPGWRGNPLVRAAYATWMKILWRSCDRLIFVCESDFRYVLSRRLVKAELCTVIPNGIGSSRSFFDRDRARQELRLADDDRRMVVGTVARLEYAKDLDLFLHVAKSMRGENIVFRIVGDGPDLPRLQQRIVADGLSETVRIHHEAKDGFRLMPGFDVFLMTSRYEGLPYTLLEAGLAGLPSVSVAVGGVPEAVADGQSGLLVHKRDAATLADALKCLMNDSARRQAMGDAAQQRIRKLFSETQMVERTLSQYAQVISK